MNKVSWLGAGLVVLGLAMLVDRLNLVRFGWETALWLLLAVYGAVKAVDAFGKKKAGRVFWGALFFLFGSYSLLRDLGVVELHSSWMLPHVILIVGLSFLMMYASSPREWHLLVPTLAFLGLGVVMILTDYGYLYRYEVVDALRVYWPVGLIMFGLALVVRRIVPHSRS
jgi:hypothetical protein